MTTGTTPSRELDLDSLVLKAGKHYQSAEPEMCVMEAVAFVAGEKWTDAPQCASLVLSDFLRSWNDAMDDVDRQQLKVLIPRIVGTAGTEAQELRRSWMALDWHCRVSAPAWLRLAGLEDEAKAVENCAEIVDEASAKDAYSALDTARVAANAARDAARSAAGDAAWSAARSAAGSAAWSAAGDAAGDAAWSAAGDAAWSAARSAAGSAAGDAAWSAARSAAGDAAWDAAWDVLRPTVVALQASAIELAERMIAVTAGVPESAES